MEEIEAPAGHLMDGCTEEAISLSGWVKCVMIFPMPHSGPGPGAFSELPGLSNGGECPRLRLPQKMEAPLFMVGNENNPVGTGEHHISFFTLGNRLFQFVYRVFDDHNTQRRFVFSPVYGQL